MNQWTNAKQLFQLALNVFPCRQMGWPGRFQLPLRWLSPVFGLWWILMVWNHLKPFETVWNRLKPFETVWNHQFVSFSGSPHPKSSHWSASQHGLNGGQVTCCSQLQPSCSQQRRTPSRPRHTRLAQRWRCGCGHPWKSLWCKANKMREGTDFGELRWATGSAIPGINWYLTG